MKVVRAAADPPPHWNAMLPCPFCNGRAKLFAHEMRGGCCENACVGCERCGSAGPMVDAEYEERKYEVVVRQAIRLWNRRGNHVGAEFKLRRIAAILGSSFTGAEPANAPDAQQASEGKL